MQPDFIFVIIVLILSIVIHEVSHGYAAQMLGDPTARLSGRLTLNPLKHLDPLGSIIIPALLVLSQSNFLIGWAKPVPYNPYNLRSARWGEAIVAGAGPLTNLCIALVFGLLIRFGGGMFPPAFVELSSYVVFINIILAVFNMLPVPPLDGSKVLRSLLSYPLQYRYDALFGYFSQYGMIAGVLFIFIFLTVLWEPFSLLVSFLFTLITGLS